LRSTDPIWAAMAIGFSPAARSSSSWPTAAAVRPAAAESIIAQAVCSRGVGAGLGWDRPRPVGGGDRGGEPGEGLIDLTELAPEAFDEHLGRGRGEVQVVVRSAPAADPGGEVEPLRDRDIDGEPGLGDRLGESRGGGQAADLEDDEAAAAARTGGEGLQRFASRGDEAVGVAHDCGPGGAGEHRHGGGLVEDGAGIEFTAAVELPPCPVAVGLVGAEPVPQQGQHPAGEERFVAVQHDDRGLAERPLLGRTENFQGSLSAGHPSCLRSRA
jgi:hypothetical protein